METRNDCCTCNFKGKWLLISNKNRAKFYWCMIIVILEIKSICYHLGYKDYSATVLEAKNQNPSVSRAAFHEGWHMCPPWA